LLLLLRFGLRDGKIAAIEALADPATAARLQLGVLED
jgi:hypothetical protein